MPSMETGDVAELISEIRSLDAFETITVPDPATAQDVPFAVLPSSKKIESLVPIFEAFRGAPVRRKGEAKIRDRASFIAHVDAFKDDHSAIFAVPDRENPRLLAVYDYNEKGGIAVAKPRFGQHRALYRCALSEQWKAWQEVNGEDLSQPEFAAFLEDHIEDVCLVDGPHIAELAQLLEAKVGGPSTMLKLSRGLQVTATTTVHNAVTLATGEVQVVFTEQHKDGNGPITTPNLFFLNIPVFEGGDAYQVAVRLRYRLNAGRLSWSIVLYRDDKIFDDAFKGVVDKVKESTDVAVYLGEPEA
ncbi:MAG: DUF2303 family protein [Gemmatimonadota bacterium]|nr:DUF2303 family protein [Gemmatimonadota bacterium]